MLEIVSIVRRSIQEGINGTEYEDRILGHQSGAAIRQELDRRHPAIDLGRLLDHLVVHRHEIARVKAEFFQPEVDLVQPEDDLAPEEIQIHPVQRRAVADQHAALAPVAVVKQRKPGGTHLQTPPPGGIARGNIPF